MISMGLKYFLRHLPDTEKIKETENAKRFIRHVGFPPFDLLNPKGVLIKKIIIWLWAICAGLFLTLILIIR